MTNLEILLPSRNCINLLYKRKNLFAISNLLVHLQPYNLVKTPSTIAKLSILKPRSPSVHNGVTYGNLLYGMCFSVVHLLK